MASLLAQVIEIATLFGGVAGTDPLSALLLLLGTVIIGGSVAVLGYLALGAAIELATPA